MRKKKHSILLEWAVSYAVVLIIPLITIFLNYSFSMETIREGIYDAHETVLENVGNEIDELMIQQTNVYSYLYSDAIFNNWASHENMDAEFYSDASRLQKQISSYVKYSSDVYCLLYMVDKNYIVNNDSANNAKHIYIAMDTFYDDSSSYEEWLAFLSGNYNNEFLFAQNVNREFNQECLVYADSLELSGNQLVNIFISIPLEKIESLTDSLEMETNLIMRYANHLELINGEENAITEDLRDSICTAAETFETEQYMGIVKESKIQGFDHCMLIAKQDFWTKSMHIRNLFLISLIITLFIAFMIVSFLLRRNFAPLSRLMEIISGEKKQGNEFYQIELAYSRLKNDNKSMRQILQGQKETLLGNYLLSVMKRRRKSLSENEISFFELEKDTPIMLCGFHIETDDELLRFAFNNVFTELMMGEHFCRVEDGEYLLYMIFISEEEKNELLKKCDQQAAYVLKFFEEKWGIKIDYRRTHSLRCFEQMDQLYHMLMGMFLDRNKEEKSVESINEDIRGIVAEIIDYIEMNYKDSNINISVIANHINRNPKYISRVFKETMGEGILDYLNRIRITKAKELIATRRYSAEETGTLVGYASNQTFRRAFMKIVGMTPGKYMDSLQQRK